MREIGYDVTLRDAIHMCTYFVLITEETSLRKTDIYVFQKKINNFYHNQRSQKRMILTSNIAPFYYFAYML